MITSVVGDKVSGTGASVVGAKVTGASVIGDKVAGTGASVVGDKVA